MLSDPERAELRELLHEQLDGTRARIVDLEEELRSIVESSEGANIDDEHDPEGSTIAFERAMVLTLLDSARAGVDDLERALTDDARGHCTVCGGPIPWERLVAFPTATTCVGCA